MVLEPAMKKFAYLAIGALLGLVCGTLIVIPFNHWYGSNFVHGDDDFNFLVGLLIVVWLLSLVIGGFVGRMFWRRGTNHRSAKS